MITIYTDGACSGNPGPGGWGAVLKYKNKEKYLNGESPLTTNNIMELTAVIEALSALKPTTLPIILYSDSQYVVKGITEWIANWKRKGFAKIKNVTLWKKLDSLNSKFNIEWVWVKGHAEDEYNNLADRLAHGKIKTT